MHELCHLKLEAYLFRKSRHLIGFTGRLDAHPQSATVYRKDFHHPSGQILSTAQTNAFTQSYQLCLAQRYTRVTSRAPTASVTSNLHRVVWPHTILQSGVHERPPKVEQGFKRKKSTSSRRARASDFEFLDACRCTDARMNPEVERPPYTAISRTHGERIILIQTGQFFLSRRIPVQSIVACCGEVSVCRTHGQIFCGPKYRHNPHHND